MWLALSVVCLKSFYKSFTVKLMSAMCVTILPGMGISINKVIVHFLVCSLSLSSIQQSGNVACTFCFTASPLRCFRPLPSKSTFLFLLFLLFYVAVVK